jgi:hypothetical protein
MGFVLCVCVCREGVGEAIPGDGEGQDCAAVCREAASAQQEEHQAQEETLQDGMLLFSVPPLYCRSDFVQVLESYRRFSCEYELRPAPILELDANLGCRCQ